MKDKIGYEIYDDILQTTLSNALMRFPSHTLNTFSPSNPLTRFAKVAGYSALRLVPPAFRSASPPKELQGKVWLYVVSQNNVDSLKFIEDALPDTVFVAGQNKQIGKYNDYVSRISYKKKIQHYWKAVPLYLHLYKKKPEATLRLFDLIYQSIGCYEVYDELLQECKPKAIIFSNDHNPDSRAMLLAAKKHSIPTVFLQHATALDVFPPLGFDLNLLEGQDSLEKYKKCGPVSGEVKLIGMPKADAFIQKRNTSKTIRTLGVCSNMIDTLDGLEQVVKMLHEHFPDIPVSFRPHPGDKRNFDFLQQLHSNLQFSDAKKEGIMKYLERQDAVIAGNTSVHLEATLLNIVSIYYKFNTASSLSDTYGFLEHNLIEKADTTTDLKNILEKYLNNKPDVYQRAKYYNATLGTEYEGRSSELAVKYLQEFIENWTVSAAAKTL